MGQLVLFGLNEFFIAFAKPKEFFQELHRNSGSPDEPLIVGLPKKLIDSSSCVFVHD